MAAGATTTAASKRFAAAKAARLAEAAKAAKVASAVAPLASAEKSTKALGPAMALTPQGLELVCAAAVQSVGLSVKSTAVALYTGTFTLQGLVLGTKKVALAYPTLIGFAIGLLVMVATNSDERITSAKSQPKGGESKVVSLTD